MEFLKYFIFSLCAVYILAILIISVRSKKAFRNIFLNALLGWLLLVLIYFTRKYTGIPLFINKITVGVSGIFGMIGVIALLFLNLII